MSRPEGLGANRMDRLQGPSTKFAPATRARLRRVSNERMKEGNMISVDRDPRRNRRSLLPADTAIYEPTETP